MRQAPRKIRKTLAKHQPNAFGPRGNYNALDAVITSAAIMSTAKKTSLCAIRRFPIWGTPDTLAALLRHARGGRIQETVAAHKSTAARDMKTPKNKKKGKRRKKSFMYVCQKDVEKREQGACKFPDGE